MCVLPCDASLTRKEEEGMDSAMEIPLGAVGISDRGGGGEEIPGRGQANTCRAGDGFPSEVAMNAQSSDRNPQLQSLV